MLTPQTPTYIHTYNGEVLSCSLIIGCSLSNLARRYLKVEVVASIQCHKLIFYSCITYPESRKYLVESIPKLKPKTSPVKCTN